MAAVDNPLVASAPVEIPLANAPLVRVIAQVRYPLTPAVAQRDFIVPFHQAIRSGYPVLREDKTQRLAISSPGVQHTAPEPTWRFSDVEGRWRVSLSSEFVALDTTAYKSRSDFVSRFRMVVEALAKYVEPKLVDRLGLRYIDRVEGGDVEKISQLVRPEVRGISGAPISANAVHSISESMFEVADARILARWGLLPPNTTVDPAAIEPSSQRSWVLDLDMFSTGSKLFVAEEVVRDLSVFAERIYTFFRWAVTPEFLKRYGGGS